MLAATYFSVWLGFGTLDRIACMQGEPLPRKEVASEGLAKRIHRILARQRETFADHGDPRHYVNSSTATVGNTGGPPGKTIVASDHIVASPAHMVFGSVAGGHVAAQTNSSSEQLIDVVPRAHPFHIPSSAAAARTALGSSLLDSAKKTFSTLSTAQRRRQSTRSLMRSYRRRGTRSGNMFAWLPIDGHMSFLSAESANASAGLVNHSVDSIKKQVFVVDQSGAAAPEGDAAPDLGLTNTDARNGVSRNSSRLVDKVQPPKAQQSSQLLRSAAKLKSHSVNGSGPADIQSPNAISGAAPLPPIPPSGTVGNAVTLQPTAQPATQGNAIPGAPPVPQQSGGLDASAPPSQQATAGGPAPSDSGGVSTSTVISIAIGVLLLAFLLLLADVLLIRYRRRYAHHHHEHATSSRNHHEHHPRRPSNEHHRHWESRRTDHSTERRPSPPSERRMSPLLAEVDCSSPEDIAGRTCSPKDTRASSRLTHQVDCSNPEDTRISPKANRTLSRSLSKEAAAVSGHKASETTPLSSKRPKCLRASSTASMDSSTIERPKTPNSADHHHQRGDWRQWGKHPKSQKSAMEYGPNATPKFGATTTFKNADEVVEYSEDEVQV